jgi:nuclear pore complex protein Nup98-Nup96
MGVVYQAYELYLTAQLYNAAHELAVMELAPDAIIRKDLDLLRDIFERLNSKKVDNWSMRGKVRLTSGDLEFFDSSDLTGYDRLSLIMPIF